MMCEKQLSNPYLLHSITNTDIYLKDYGSCPTEYAEAMGGAIVDSACVIPSGPVKTAAAPWKLPPVWQQTSRCATVEGCVSAANVNVWNHSLARPVRAALTVRTHVRSTWSVWSVGRLGRERRRTGENTGAYEGMWLTPTKNYLLLPMKLPYWPFSDLRHETFCFIPFPQYRLLLIKNAHNYFIL